MYEEVLQNISTVAKDFDSHLIRIRTLNSQLITRSDKLLEEIKNLLEKINKNKPKQCQICFSNPISMCFSSCATCRTRIENIIKIFP